MPFIDSLYRIELSGVCGLIQGLEGAICTIAQHLGLLRKLLDSIALLDMLCSFATIATTSSKKYVRPKLEDNGPVAILQGRHPVHELRQGVDFQPNDTYITTCSSCHIITGPNMSGKSTYLKQVAQCSVKFQTTQAKTCAQNASDAPLRL